MQEPPIKKQNSFETSSNIQFNENKNEQKTVGKRIIFTNDNNYNKKASINQQILNVSNKSLNQLKDHLIFDELEQSKNSKLKSKKPFNTAYSSFFKNIQSHSISKEESIDRIKAISESLRNLSLLKVPKIDSKPQKLSSSRSNKLNKNTFYEKHKIKDI